MDKKKCIQCENFIVGRTDKKFCSSTCRSRYFYSLNAGFNAHKSKVHEILRKNRDILAELNPSGKCIVDKQLLDERDFNFNFFTTLYRTKSGHVYWFCYDYGFRKFTKNNFYQLVRWQSYMAQCTSMNLEKNIKIQS
jgi:hypothetical protein